MSRALVLGGGGHLGAALCAALLARGWEVVTTTKGAGKRRVLDGLAATRRVGDDTVPGQLETWIAGASLVVDAAAPYGLALHEPGLTHGARLAQAEARMGRLLTACAHAGAPLVYVGSYLTSPDRARPARDRMLAATHPYFRIKRRLEAQALGAARQGQAVSILNPTSLLGPGNLRPFNQCFVAAVMSGQMPGSFPDVINVIDVRDAAEAILRVHEAGHFGRPVRISGHDIDVHSLTDRIVALSGARRPPRWRALGAGAAVLYWAESALALTGRQSGAPALPVLLTLASRAVGIGPEQARLGPHPRALDDTLRDEIAFYRARGSDKVAPVVAHAQT